MLVGELIEKLQKFDKDTEVIFDFEQMGDDDEDFGWLGISGVSHVMAKINKDVVEFVNLIKDE